MAHIVFFSYGGTSCLNANYRLAHQLAERDHQITFVSSVDVKKAVNAQGFNFVLLDEEHTIRHNSERLRLERLPSYRRYLNRTALIRIGENQKEYFLKSREFDKIIQQINPDLLLIEEELSEYIVAAEKFDIPKVLIQHWPGTRKAANVPPLDSNIIPQDTWWSKLNVELAWQMLQIKEKLKYLAAPLYYKGTDRRSILRALCHCREIVFEEAVDLTQWLPIFPHLSTIFMSAWEFDFPHTVNDKSYYVGPMIFSERQDTFVDSHYQQVQQELLSKRQFPEDRFRPVVYCAMGSMISNDNFFQRVIDAFAEKPEYDLVMSIGHQIPIEFFEPVPTNVYLLTYVPQLDILKYVDLMLTHGGIGTINECIFFGVPMLVYSAGILDQNGNAARVAYHGLGLRGHMHKESKEEISKKVDQILSDPQYKANVNRMQQIYRDYDNSDKAVQIIERML